MCIALDPKWASHRRASCQFSLRIKSHPAPRHRAQLELCSAPMPLQEGHSFQSESLIALEFVPVHRSPSTVFPQRRLMRVGLYPALPHSVQVVTGIGRLVDMSTLPRTITREVLARGLRPWNCVDPSLNLFGARQMVDAFFRRPCVRMLSTLDD